MANICNSTVLFPKTVSSNVIIFLAVDFLIATLTIAGNSIFILALIKARELHTPSNMLLGALCLSDLLVGFIVHPMFFTLYLKALLQREHDQTIEKIIFTAQHICTGMSFLFGVIVSLDRYAAICHPYRYHIFANCKTHFWIAILTGMTWAFIPIIDRFINEPLFLAVSTSSGILIGIPLILFSYYKIYIVIRKQKRQVHTLGTIETSTARVQRQDGTQILRASEQTSSTAKRRDETDRLEPLDEKVVTVQRQDGTQIPGTIEVTAETVQMRNETHAHEVIETTAGVVPRRGETLIRATIEATAATVQRQDETNTQRTTETASGAVQRREATHTHGTTEAASGIVQKPDETNTHRTTETASGTVQRREATHTHGTTEAASGIVQKPDETNTHRTTETASDAVQRRGETHTHGTTEAASGTVQNQEKTRRKREKDRTRMILIILLCQLVCFAPYFTLTLYFMATSTICFDTPTKLILDLWAAFILLVNSCINPLIYCLKCEKIRNSTLRHLCVHRRDGSQSSNTMQSEMEERP
eukprot:Seg1640.7 transcript_id=Seg1640.7/GoldUCD/mRNA.D3Y31 product="Trace amine-associated receptor 1" protein_id=Seg1640.7/GoldUCD/D3Y31